MLVLVCNLPLPRVLSFLSLVSRPLFSFHPPRVLMFSRFVCSVQFDTKEERIKSGADETSRSVSMQRRMFSRSVASRFPSDVNCRLTALCKYVARTVMMHVQSSAKPEGDISSVFASLSGDQANQPLEPRSAQLKARITEGYESQVTDSWYRLLDALKRENTIIRSSDNAVIPSVELHQMRNLSSSAINAIRTRGVMIVRGVLSEDYALKFKLDAEEYIRRNPHTKAFPQDKPVVYELYWSPSQIRARAHSRVAETLSFANSFWHASPSARVSLKENLIYAERVTLPYSKAVGKRMISSTQRIVSVRKCRSTTSSAAARSFALGKAG